MNNTDSERTMFCVQLPATQRTYDFWVPDCMPMFTASKLICQAMQTIEPDAFLYNGNQTLMYERTGQIQQPSATVREIGFVDGDVFVIV